MSLEQVGIIFSIIVGILAIFSSIGGIFGIWISMSMRFAKIEVKVDTLWEAQKTMWEFQLRRGASEIIQQGIGTMNSPIIITDEAKSWFNNMSHELKVFYQKVGLNISDTDFSLLLEKEFGYRIMQEISIPKGLEHASSLIIATSIAKEPETLIVN